MPGFLLTCEGIDGSGKSTAARALVDELRARGHDARLHVEPTRTWLGEAVRRGFKEDVAPWTEVLLFMADHATHVRDTRAELAAGALVVSDRWSDSTFAYQGAALGAISGEGPARPEGRVGGPPEISRTNFDGMDALIAMEKPFDLAPDLTLLFDLDPRLAMDRIGARGAEREKFERLDFLARVRANYLRLAKMEPARFVVLDAARPADAVFHDALAAVLKARSSKQA